MTNSFNELVDSRCILAIGTNTTEAHPVIALRVHRAVDNGAKLIVIDPRETGLVRESHLWLRLKPGSNIPLLNAMAKVIIDEGLADQKFISERCEDYEAYKQSLQACTLDYAERETGVPKDKIAQAARLYAACKPAAIIYAMGIAHFSHGTDNVIATANLAMLTGNIGKPGSGVNPLRGQNNVQGACDMGALPTVYSGYQPVDDSAARQKFQQAWGVTLNPNPGLTMTDTFEAIHRGKIKAMYIIGENPALSEPDIKHAVEALEKLEFLVVQDIFMTETAQLADVVLAGASFAEKDGTFTNTERRVQRVRQAIQPVGDSRPDWRITTELAKKMGGKDFEYDSPAAIMAEINRLTPSYGGITWERLEEQGLQWPCPTAEHPGTPILHTEKFTRGKGKFIPVTYQLPAELPDSQYPLVLITIRSLYQYHTGTMTRKVAGLNVLKKGDEVEIHPADAARLGIADGETVRVSSRRGQVTVQARVTDVTPEGSVYMTFHFAESPTNVLTIAALDPVARVPEFKFCAVRVEKA
jgi:formate dehydrogenase alpha subunit